MRSEGCAPEQFPFQAFVHKLYMVFTAKKKSKNRVADPTKNNPYLFIPSVFFENPWRSPA
jgi:hypothetical protein